MYLLNDPNPPCALIICFQTLKSTYLVHHFFFVKPSRRREGFIIDFALLLWASTPHKRLRKSLPAPLPQKGVIKSFLTGLPFHLGGSGWIAGGGWWRDDDVHCWGSFIVWVSYFECIVWIWGGQWSKIQFSFTCFFFVKITVIILALCNNQLF